MFPYPTRSGRGLPGTVLGLLILMLAATPGCDRREGGQAQREARLAQSEGRWLIVNYWAEWCRPCLEEIPQLNAFARKHADRARVVLVNYDGVSGEELRAQAGKLGIQTELLDEKSASRLGLPRPRGLPSTFLITPDGTLHDVLLGAQTVESLERVTRLAGDD